MKNSMYLSIIIPCLNEEQTISICIKKAQQFMSRNGIIGEVVVADNGSLDNSKAIALTMGAKIVEVEAKGYGNAILSGIEAASGDFVIVGDADNSYDFSELMMFVKQFEHGDDLVIGNRFKGGIAAGAMPILHRYLGNPVLSALGRFLFEKRVGDFHCGLRGFNRDMINGLKLRASGMEFASEIIVKASLKGLIISEVPVKLYKDGRNRKPHLRTWQDGWRHLKFLILLCPRWLFLYPGIFLGISGLLICLAIVFNEIVIGNIHFGIHTYFYSALCHLMGIQLIMFYFFIKTCLWHADIINLKGYQKKVIEWFSFERGIMAGTVTAVVGIICSFCMVLSWKESNYSNLNPAEAFKFIIPSGLLTFVGFQIVFASFFISSTTNLKLKE